MSSHDNISKTRTAAVQTFLSGKMNFDQLQDKLGKSRATIYRYIKMVHDGKQVVDNRQFGNNRKYGKKKA